MRRFGRDLTFSGPGMSPFDLAVLRLDGFDLNVVVHEGLCRGGVGLEFVQKAGPILILIFIVHVQGLLRGRRMAGQFLDAVQQWERLIGFHCGRDGRGIARDTSGGESGTYNET